ncbi:MAG: hypothetical protein DMG69_15495 [Acidobacteria bacterium]|nr:MAG: hypothetical protein DMG69_15495 [Acidobacteriota bacterium]
MPSFWDALSSQGWHSRIHHSDRQARLCRRRTIPSRFSSEGKKHLKQQTISSLVAALDPARFLGVHRSYIVNLEKVTKIEPFGKGETTWSC